MPPEEDHGHAQHALTFREVQLCEFPKLISIGLYFARRSKPAACYSTPNFTAIGVRSRKKNIVAGICSTESLLGPFHGAIAVPSVTRVVVVVVVIDDVVDIARRLRYSYSWRATSDTW